MGVECVFWYFVSNFKNFFFFYGLEVAMGIDGRRGDHFFLNYKDWLVEREPLIR